MIVPSMFVRLLPNELALTTSLETASGRISVLSPPASANAMFAITRVPLSLTHRVRSIVARASMFLNR